MWAAARAARSTWIAVVVVGLSASLPYLNTLHGDFCYDDKVAVGGNPDVCLDHVTILDIFTHDYWGNDILRRRKGGWTHDSWRPLVTLSFRANHRIGKLKTFNYHVTNLVIHALCCITAFFVFRCLFHATHSLHPHALALAAGILFGLHPVHSETVANITGRADPMAAFFCFLSVLAYLHGREQLTTPRSFLWHLTQCTLSFLSVLLGLMCKETSLVMPALLVVLDTAVQLQRLPGLIQQQVKSSDSSSSWRVYPRAVLAALAATLPLLRTSALLLAGAGLYYVRIVHFSNGYDLKDFANEMHNPLAYIKEAVPRLRAVAFVQSWAMSMLVLPMGLSHEHSAHVLVQAWTDPRNLLTVLVLVTMLACIVWSLCVLFPRGNAEVRPAQVGRAVRILLAMGWIIISYAPASHAFLFVAFVIAERTLFFPSWAACFLLAECVEVCAGTWWQAEDGAHRSQDGSSDGAQVVRGKDSSVSVTPSLNTLSSQVETSSPTCGATPVPVSIPVPTAGSTPPPEGVHKKVTWADKKPSGRRKASIVGIAAAELPLTLEQPSAVTSSAGAEAVASTSAPRASSSMPPLRASLPCLALSIYYAWATWQRGWDWVDEEALLESNLRLYPRESNGMTLYGLGAIRAYQEKWDEAEELLLQATRATSLAEPHILLSQVAWRGRGNASEAVRHLERIEYTSSPRKEVMQNLGLLLTMLGRAPWEYEEARIRVERLVLIGHSNHGYPSAHPHIGLLASNAACIRLMSEPYRYGHPDLARELAEEGTSYEHTHKFSSYRNLAVVHMVQGRAQEALAAIHACESCLGETMQEHVEKGTDSNTMVDLARDVHAGLQRLKIALQVHGAAMHRWAQGEPVSGSAARERMDRLGVECHTELLFW